MTRPPKDKAIQRLQKALNAIEDLKQQQRRSSSPEFAKWHRNTEIAIANTFGEDSRPCKRFHSGSFTFFLIAVTSSTDRIREATGWYIQRARAGYCRFAIND